MMGSSLFSKKLRQNLEVVQTQTEKRKKNESGNHVRKVVKPMEAKLKKEMVKT